MTSGGLIGERVGKWLLRLLKLLRMMRLLTVIRGLLSMSAISAFFFRADRLADRLAVRTLGSLFGISLSSHLAGWRAGSGGG